MDSMILCKFLRGVFTDPFTEWAALLAGHRLGHRRRRAARHGAADRAREAAVQPARGRHAADDRLPERMLTESLELESGRIATLTAERLEAMVSSYTAPAAWSRDGRAEPGDLARPAAGGTDAAPASGCKSGTDGGLMATAMTAAATDDRPGRSA